MIVKKWIPWDHLQLDKSSGLSHKSNSINFRLMFMRGRKKRFSIDSKTGSVLLINDENIYLPHIAKRSGDSEAAQKLSDAHFFNFGEPNLDLIAQLNEVAPWTIFHDYKKNFSDFLEDLLVFQSEIESSMKKDHLTSLTNKRFQVILVYLDHNSVIALSKNLKDQINLERFISKTKKLRTPIVISIPDSVNLTKDFLDNFDVVAWLGEENQNKVKNLYPELNMGRVAYARVRRGTIKSKEYPFLVPAYSWKFEESEWRKEFIINKSNVKSTYEDFLNSLEDGSDDTSWRRSKKSFPIQ